MEINEYTKLIEELTEYRNNISNQKRKDYTKGSKDVFNNFKSVAENTGLNPLQVLLVYANKHWDAICNYIKTNGQSESEPIKDRISDLLVYLELMWGLINDLGIGMKRCVDSIKDLKYLDNINEKPIEIIGYNEKEEYDTIPFPDENVEYKSMTRPLPPIEEYENYYGDSENIQDKLDWDEKETGKSFGI